MATLVTYRPHTGGKVYTIFLPMSAAMSKLFNERGHFNLILKWLYQGFKISVTKFDWAFAVKLELIVAF